MSSFSEHEFGTTEWGDALLAELTEGTTEVLKPFVERLDITEQVAISTADFIGELVAAISALVTVVVQHGLVTSEEFEKLAQDISEHQAEQATLDAMEQDVTGGGFAGGT